MYLYGVKGQKKKKGGECDFEMEAVAPLEPRLRRGGWAVLHSRHGFFMVDRLISIQTRSQLCNNATRAGAQQFH